MLARRLGAVVFIVAGAYIAAMGITVGTSIVTTLFEGPWLGLEPEILIPVGMGLVAALLMWMGLRLWKQQEHE